MTSPRYSPEALAQLEEIETYLIERAGSSVADAYLDRLLDFCDEIATDLFAGHHRDDLLLGLRTRIFERRRVVCFLVTADDIHIIAIFSAGQDWEQILRDR